MAEIEDMRLLVRAIATGSLSAAGRELGVSPARGEQASDATGK
jgi:DNA-binding transcriptional LysR family regulator